MLTKTASIDATQSDCRLLTTGALPMQGLQYSLLFSSLLLLFPATAYASGLSFSNIFIAIFLGILLLPFSLLLFITYWVMKRRQANSHSIIKVKLFLSMAGLQLLLLIALTAWLITVVYVESFTTFRYEKLEAIPIVLTLGTLIYCHYRINRKLLDKIKTGQQLEVKK